MTPAVNLSPAAHLFYGAAAFGNVAGAVEFVGQMPEPETGPYREGLVAVNPALTDRWQEVPTTSTELRSIARLIATSDHATAHLFQTPARILDEVRRVVQNAVATMNVGVDSKGTHSPARNILPHTPPPTEEDLRKILPPEKRLQSLIQKFVEEATTQYSLAEAIEIFINEYLLLQHHIEQATTDFGYDYITRMQKILKQTVAAALHQQISETLKACMKWLESADKTDPKALAAVSFLAGFREPILESLKSAWEVARRSEEAKSNAIAGRLLLIFAEIGKPSLSTLREMQQLYPDNAEFFSMAIEEIQRA